MTTQRAPSDLISIVGGTHRFRLLLKFLAPINALLRHGTPFYEVSDAPRTAAKGGRSVCRPRGVLTLTPRGHLTQGNK